MARLLNVEECVESFGSHGEAYPYDLTYFDLGKYHEQEMKIVLKKLKLEVEGDNDLYIFFSVDSRNGGEE